MSEELTKITLERLGEEYAKVIQERDALLAKLELAKEAIDISISALSFRLGNFDIPSDRDSLIKIKAIKQKLEE